MENLCDIAYILLNLLLYNHKLIGIHRGFNSSFGYKIGTLLSYPINEYNKKFYSKNEIILALKIEEKHVNKKIYFLDNSDEHVNLKEIKNKILY